jgi:hypothetical protein
MESKTLNKIAATAILLAALVTIGVQTTLLFRNSNNFIFVKSGENAIVGWRMNTATGAVSYCWFTADSKVAFGKGIVPPTPRVGCTKWGT